MPDQSILQQIKPFEKADWRIGAYQVGSTLLLSVIFWTLSVYAIGFNFFVALVPMAISSLLTVRLFIFFHDCTHNSFLPSVRANRVLGYILGIMTFASFDDWRKSHGIHHSSNGDLNKRGTGDVWLLTTEEYASLSLPKRILYRIFRNWFVLFFLIPPILFLLIHRFPGRHSGRKEKAGVLITNAGILLQALLLSLIMGFRTYLILQLIIFFGASIIGLWLFYIQHNFIPGFWVRTEFWNRVDAALKGCSFLQLHPLFNWFTGSIGYHHIHHLNPRIPNYRLAACQNSVRSLEKVRPVRLPQALGFGRIKLWNEQENMYTDFKNNRIG